MTECPSCGHDSDTCYRCDECGRDLANLDTTTTAEQEVRSR